MSLRNLDAHEIKIRQHVEHIFVHIIHIYVLDASEGPIFVIRKQKIIVDQVNSLVYKRLPIKHCYIYYHLSEV